MTDIIFSFDTEDFTSKKAADAILKEAEILRKEGVTGCFCLVGHLADQLVAWKRDDVLRALSFHEIHNHSLGHSLHPTINEYTDIPDANEAIARVLEQESLANEKIRAATGTERIYAAVPPGNSKSYAAMYAYAKMGIPIYADSVCDTNTSSGAYYCNIFNTKYTVSFESLFLNGKNTDVAALLDKLSSLERAIIYTHPNIATHKEWWDGINYKGENKHPFGKWEACIERDEDETERFYASIRDLVRRIKNDSRFRITSYKELARELENEGERTVRKSDIPSIKASLEKRFYPISSPVSLSIADIMLTARDILLGAHEHRCASVYGFLDIPYGVKKETRLTADDIISAANDIKDREFLPSRLMAGSVAIGPADWLFAALDVILGKKEVLISPKDQLPSFNELPELRDMTLKNSWIHSPDFKDEYLSQRLRLQAYTLRFRAK